MKKVLSRFVLITFFACNQQKGISFETHPSKYKKVML